MGLEGYMTKNEFDNLADKIIANGVRSNLGGTNDNYNFYRWVDRNIDYSLYDYGNDFAIIEIYSYSRQIITTYRKNNSKLISKKVDFNVPSGEVI